MVSFLDKLRSSAGGNASSSTAAPKRDPKEPPQTWLHKLKDDPEPIKEDGSDKFFGAENFGNTCYFNSVLQCLYYSIPLRELVLNYPSRSPVDTIINDAEGKPRAQPAAMAEQNGQSLSPAKRPTPIQTSARSAAVPPAPNKPEDKESPEYKKKQAMLNGPVLSLDYDNSPTYGMEPSLFTCLKDMFEGVVTHPSRTGVFSPRLFLKMLQDQNVDFRGAMHQDAQEFFGFVLNAVIDTMEEYTRKADMANEGANGHAANGHEVPTQLSKPNIANLKTMSKQIEDMFRGLSTSETKCLTCENVSQRDETFLELTLQIENHCSVTSCLRKYSEEEMLCERNKFFCDKCGGLQEAEKRMKLKRLPRVLALHLKRFTYNEDATRLQKLFHRVVYPYHLRLFNTTDDIEDPDRLYELYAVVVHIGSGPHHGHYISIIKTPDRGWLLFDDEMVEPVDKSFIRNFFGAQVGMACAYLLFYQETTLEAVKKEQESEGLAAAAAAMAAETTVHVNGKDINGLGLNFKMNGAPSPGAAADEDSNVINPLVHANTAPTPLSPTNASSIPTPIIATHTPITPNLPGTPGRDKSPLTPRGDKKAESAAKKAEEKERKAAEKAAKEERKAQEKEEKARKKSMDQRNRESAKQAAKEARASLSQRRKTNDNLALPEPGTLAPPNGTNTTIVAPVVGASPSAARGATTIPAANQSNAQETVLLSTSSPSSSQTHPQSENLTALPQPTENSSKHTHSSSFSGSSALNRFRASSKSVSIKKSKFWGRESRDLGKRDSKDLGVKGDKEADKEADKSGDDVAVYDGDGGSDGDKSGEKPFVGVQRAATVSMGEHSVGPSSLSSAGVESRKEKDKENKAGMLTAGGSGKKRVFSLRKKASSLLS